MSDENLLIEKVARAMATVVGKSPAAKSAVQHVSDDDAWNEYVVEAKKIVAAFRVIQEHEEGDRLTW